MRKQEFLNALNIKLFGLPKQEVEERIAFYSEMIDDRMEEGCTEEDAVLAIGSVDEIARQIIADIPLVKIAKERMKPKNKLKAWEIVLLALGSPIWLSLGVAAFAVILSIYVSLWAVIICLWAVFVSLACCAPSCAVIGIAFALGGNRLSGCVMIGMGLVCAGLAIFLFFGCKETTKGAVLLIKKIAFGVKKCFVKKENEQ